MRRPRAGPAMPGPTAVALILSCIVETRSVDLSYAGIAWVPTTLAAVPLGILLSTASMIPHDGLPTTSTTMPAHLHEGRSEGHRTNGQDSPSRRVTSTPADLHDVPILPGMGVRRPAQRSTSRHGRKSLESGGLDLVRRWLTGHRGRGVSDHHTSGRAAPAAPGAMSIAAGHLSRARVEMRHGHHEG